MDERMQEIKVSLYADELIAKAIKRKEKELVQNLIAEVKQKKFLEDLHRQNTIDMDDYFKYSGKTEKSTEDYNYIEKNISEFDKFHRKNRKKIIKKREKYNQIISKERSKNYKKWRKK